MSVIKNAKFKYADYKSQIFETGKSLQSDYEIDLEISLKIKKDNLPKDFSFNIIYWGSPLLENKSGGEKITYVLNILKLAEKMSVPTFSIPLLNKSIDWGEFPMES